MTIIEPQLETKVVGYTVEFTPAELHALLHFIGRTNTGDSLAKGLTKEEDETIFQWYCKIDKGELDD